MLDMLTADAAAKHGHEYSPPRPAHVPSPNGSFFSQMPLSILGSVLRKQNASPSPAAGAASSAEDAPSIHEQQKSLVNSATDAPPLSPTPSRPASSSSIASADGKPKKKAPRPKTTYNLAHPHGPRQKLHIRPKVLLQLHQVIPSRRPKPAYEIIPFSLLAPRSTRRLARTFNAKDRLGPTDLLIVKAEGYGSKDDDEKSDDERWGTRDVVGIICPGKKSGDSPELLMDDGSSWTVTNMPNGGYEFSYIDDHGLALKRRWVPKPHARRMSTMSSVSQLQLSPTLDDKKFNFSTISANSRRHPVIANMSRTNIEVYDSYAMPSATSPPTPSLPPSGFTTPLATPASITDMSSFMNTSADRLPVETDDTLRKFILISGVWVAFCENWSPAYSSSKGAPSPLATSTRPSAPARTVSMSFIESPRSASPASTIDESLRSIPRIFRAGTQKLHSSASFSNPVASPASTKVSPSSSPKLKTRSRRSNSTGNAEFTTARKGSTRKRFGLALEDQTLPETEEERQTKRSTEILRIKELAGAIPDNLSESPAPPAFKLAPVKIIEPPSEFRSPSPASPNPRNLKAQSAYNPVTTAGLWDSGVAEGPGLKSRPTSLVVVNEKKEKAKRKQQRSKSKENKEGDKERDGRRRSERFKQRFLGIFRKERA